jgi:hypothetical protein
MTTFAVQVAKLHLDIGDSQAFDRDDDGNLPGPCGAGVCAWATADRHKTSEAITMRKAVGSSLVKAVSIPDEEPEADEIKSR